MSNHIVVGPDETVYFRASAEDDTEFRVRVLAPDTPADDPQEPAQVRTYSQRDPRYADQVYAGGLTFGAAGCLVCSIAMIASLVYEGEPLTYPPEVARRLRAAECFNGGLLSHPSRISRAFDRLWWGGALHWRNSPADLSVLAGEVERHGATICEVKFNPSKPLTYEANGRTIWNQHFVVVEAVDVDGNDAVIVDPWTGKRQMLTQSPYAKPLGWSASRALYGVRMVRAQ